MSAISTKKAKFQVKNWISDFEELEQMISRTYPNLDDLTAANKLDLFDLNIKTRTRLKSAGSDKEVVQIFKDFLAQFKDGHLKLEEEYNNYTSKPETAVLKLSATTEGPLACKNLVNSKVSL